MRSLCVSRSFLPIVLCLLTGNVATARDKSSELPAGGGDEIVVIGHVTIEAKEFKNILAASHWGRQYLYLSGAGQTKVIDATDGAKPAVVNEYSYPAMDRLQVAVGNAALFATMPASDAAPRQVSIMSFADPLKPQVTQRFLNVSAFLIDKNCGLIYVVNDDGLWILQEKPGRDSQLDKDYSRQILYNR